jgi:hypothetical protein
VKRRTYLGTLATVTLAGCTGSRGGGGTTDDETSDQTTDQTSDQTTDEQTTTDGTTDAGVGFPYHLDNVQTDDSPVEDVTIGVTVTENLSRDQPARLEVAFTNDADEARTFSFGSLVPWDTVLGKNAEGQGTLLLAPDDGVVPEEPSDDCWQATDGIALPAVMREETLDPGETVTGEFHVLAAHDSDECHPIGTYRFEDENYLDEGWGFSVDVGAIVEN